MIVAINTDDGTLWVADFIHLDGRFRGAVSVLDDDLLTEAGMLLGSALDGMVPPCEISLDGEVEGR